MDADFPTIRSRQLGDAMRQALRATGLSGKEFARKIGWDEARLSRYLSGKRTCPNLDLATFLGACEVKGAERERLLWLGEEANRPGLLQQFGTGLPKQLRILVDLEDNAAGYIDFQPNMIPGMLQTGAYARALLTEAGNDAPDEIDERVAARLARQSLLSREQPVQFGFFIHEFVLRLPVGGSVVMSEQLHHLLRMAVRPNIELRIIPAAQGAHAGIAGPFMLLDIVGFKPVVYLESQTASVFLEEPAEIATYRSMLGRLAETALDARQSKELIGNTAMELYPDGENSDDHAQIGGNDLAEEQLQRWQQWLRRSGPD
ncbi:helix-turn-helix protein [Tamaricihabitans halophyticus]|uniref:Helix-turn-helix protein n=1 Tax=Tamaricihabitans halophyticus TaxID=1262583 RepID=A0A4R2R1G8_9PSEU|nr:helix-turn-helix transcriptional regulator [Tamaricihabitans halophyticus]TCP56522.1 helix-turn-helix protein [Tamaricihabitans halophyticus]